MAQKKKAAGKAEEKVDNTKKEKKAKKVHEPGQRPNSKQIDIIDMGANGKVVNYAYSIRKIGVLVTSIALDGEGNVVGTSLQLIPGTKVKTKKEHGQIQPGVAGEGKKKKGEESEEEVAEEPKGKKKK